MRKWREGGREKKKGVTHEVSERLQTKQRNVRDGRPLGSDYRCTAALAGALRPQEKGRTGGLDGDAVRSRAQEERRGQSGEQSEERCWAGGGNEDNFCLLLSCFTSVN